MSKMMLKGIDSDDYIVIFPFDTVVIQYNGDDEYIECLGIPNGSTVEDLMDIDHDNKVAIADLKCRTYDELVVQLDLHNLLFAVNDVNEHDGIKNKTDAEKNNIIRELRQENRKLKQKLKGLKMFLDKE